MEIRRSERTYSCEVISLMRGRPGTHELEHMYSLVLKSIHPSTLEIRNRENIKAISVNMLARHNKHTNLLVDEEEL